jgi:hypothetical protein
MEFAQLRSLLEYLVSQSDDQHLTEFEVKIKTSDTNFLQAHAYAHPALQTAESMRCTVFCHSLRSLEDLFVISEQEREYRIQSLYWRSDADSSSHDSTSYKSVRINLVSREVEIHTDSISFLEICRHRLTGQGIRKIAVDLKIAS